MTDQPKDRLSPAALKVRYKSADVDEFIKHSNKDISLVGIFIKTKTPMKEGVPLKLEFQLENGTPLIRGVGQVTWRREVAQSEDRPSGMGIKFLKLDAASRQVIERAVKARGSSPSRFDRLGDAAARETSDSGRIVHKRTGTPLGAHAAGIFSSEKPSHPPESGPSTPDSISGLLPTTPFKSPFEQEKPPPKQDATAPTASEPSGVFSPSLSPRPLPEPQQQPAQLAPIQSEQEILLPDARAHDHDGAAERVKALEQELFSDLNTAFERLDVSERPIGGSLSDLIPTVIPGAALNDIPVNQVVLAPRAECIPASHHEDLYPSRAVTDESRANPESPGHSSFGGENIEAVTYPSADKGQGYSREGASVEEPKHSLFDAPQRPPVVPRFTPIRSASTPPVLISRLFPASTSDSRPAPISQLSQHPGESAVSLPTEPEERPITTSPIPAAPPTSPAPAALPSRPPLFVDAAAPIGLSRPGAQSLKPYVIGAIVACIVLGAAIVYLFSHRGSDPTRATPSSPGAEQNSSPTVGRDPGASSAATPVAEAAATTEEKRAPAGPTVDVLVTSTPEKAFVTVGGTPRGQTPIKVPLPLGEKIAVEVKASGFAKMAMEAKAQHNQQPLYFNLSRLRYQLSVQSNPPGATVMASGAVKQAPAIIDLGQMNAPLTVVVAKTGYKKQVLQLLPEQFVEQDGWMRGAISVTLSAVPGDGRALSDKPPSSAPSQAPVAPRRQVVLLKPEEPAEAPKKTAAPTLADAPAEAPSAAPAKTPFPEMPVNPYAPTAKTPGTKKSGKVDLPANPF